MEEYGAPSVTDCGTTVKLKLYVENKDFCPLVSSMIGQGVQQYTLCLIY